MKPMKVLKVKSKMQTKSEQKTHQNIPQEDYIFYNTHEDEREARSSIGVEYKVQQREFSAYNSDSLYSY